MAITWEDLKDYIGADVSDESVLTTIASDAMIQMDAYLGTNVVPESTKNMCYLIVGQAIWDLRNSRGGFVQEQFSGADGTAWGPVRVARDPLANVYKTLAQWVNPW